MYILDNILEAIDTLTDTKSKRHIVGGVLISVSLLFGGLAITVITTKMEDDIRYGRIN